MEILDKRKGAPNDGPSARQCAMGSDLPDLVISAMAYLDRLNRWPRRRNPGWRSMKAELPFVKADKL
jgi:hypothetical protein